MSNSHCLLCYGHPAAARVLRPHVEQHAPLTPRCAAPPQDSVTEISENKKTVAAALIITALFILLPNAPEITDDLLSGGGPDNFL